MLEAQLIAKASLSQEYLPLVGHGMVMGPMIRYSNLTIDSGSNQMDMMCVFLHHNNIFCFGLILL